MSVDPWILIGPFLLCLGAFWKYVVRIHCFYTNQQNMQKRYICGQPS